MAAPTGVAGAPETRAWIGLDLGTSSLKAMALGEDGRALAEARQGYGTARPGPGRAEQQASDWTAAAETALRELAAAVPPQSWAGIGLSGMIPTLVTLDAAGKPVGPALTWEDCRAQEEAEQMSAALGAAAIYRTTGQPLDGRYLLPMVAWLGRHEPHWLARTALVAGAKDYLFGWLTGEVLTDPSTATGYGCYDLRSGRWWPAAAALARVSTTTGRPGEPRLPAVVPCVETRPLAANVAQLLGVAPGLPVCAGAADSVLAAEALGAVTPGAVAYVWGTSTVILGVAGQPPNDPEQRCLITPLAVDLWGAEMDLVSTGAAVGWLAHLLGFGDGGQAEVFEAAAAAADGLVPAMLPFVGVGEQGALWDTHVRGSLIGLDLSHGPGDVARAMLDGIILESKRCLDWLATLGLPQGEVRVAWHRASPWFCRRLADASGRRVVIGDPAVTSSAAGAARLAAIAAGAELPRAAAEGLLIEPDRAAARLWQRRWAQYEQLLQPLRRLYRTWPQPDD